MKRNCYIFSETPAHGLPAKKILVWRTSREARKMEDSGVSSSADITAANTETTPTLDEEAELAKAKDLLKSEKFDEASDALGIILERRYLPSFQTHN